MPMTMPQPWIHDTCEGWMVAETAPFMGVVSDCRCASEAVFTEVTDSLGGSTAVMSTPTPAQDSVVARPGISPAPQVRDVDRHEVRPPQRAPAAESVVAPAAQPEPPVLIPARTDEPAVPPAPTAAGVAPEVPDLKPVAPEEPPATPSEVAEKPRGDDAPAIPATEDSPPQDAVQAVVEPVSEPVTPEMKPGATEPQGAPATPPAEDPAAEEEENLFEQRPPVDTPAARVEPATEPPVSPEPPALPADGEAPTTSDQAPEPADGDAAQPEPPTDSAAPPATDPVTPEPTDAAPSSTSVEPMRRWIDATGVHATVGVLVEVRPDGAVIRRRRGGSIVVPLDRLSGHDRAYAIEAGARLAAARPGNHETAGL